MHNLQTFMYTKVDACIHINKLLYNIATKKYESNYFEVHIYQLLCKDIQ